MTDPISRNLGFTRGLFIAMTGLAAAALAMAQTQAPPAFEVASVKPAAEATGPPGPPPYSWGPGSVILTRYTLKNLLLRAYDVKAYQIEGPAWLDNDRFDINAKMPEGATKAQIPQMLQALLEERFKLTLHRETKTLPVYALVAGKGGPKLKESGATVPAGWPPNMANGAVRLSLGPRGLSAIMGRMTTAQIANAVSSSVERPVLDQTGLTGTYDIDVAWTPDERSTPIPGLAVGANDAGAVPAAGDPGPTIFTALQEKLGLKLEPRTAPVEILVIDNANKVPTGN